MFVLASRLAFSWRPVNRWRFVALTTSSALAVVVVLMIAGALRVYDAEAARQAARLPVPAEPSAAALHWAPTAERVSDRQYPVIYLEPVGDRPPVLPPGLERLPEPGAAALSPALAARAAESKVVQAWTASGQMIGLDGLQDPGELLAYVVAPEGESIQHSHRSMSVAGFGGAGASIREADAFLGTRLAPGPLRLAVFAFLVFPVGMLLATASRAAAPRRDRRIALLQALGSPRQVTLRLAALEAACLAMLGAGVGALGYHAVRPFVDRVPVVDRLFRSSDTVLSLPTTGLCVLLVASFATLVAAATAPRGWRDPVANRPGPTSGMRTRLRMVPLVAGLALCLAAVIAGGPGGSPLLLVGTALTLAGLPLVVAPVVKLIGGRLGRSRSLAASVAGRRLAFDPAYNARYIAGLVALVFLAVNVHAWSNRLQSSNETSQAAVATSTVRVSASAPLVADGRALATGPAVAVAPFVSDRQTGAETLLVDCATMRRMQADGRAAPCPAAPASSVAEVHQALKDGRGLLGGPLGDSMVGATHAIDVTAVAPADLASLRVDGFYVLAEGRRLDVAAVRQVAFAELALPFVLSPADLVQSPSPLEKWLSAGLLAAAVLAAVSVSVALVDAVFRRRDEFGSLVALGASRPFLGRLLVVEMTTALGVGIVAALTAGVLTGAAMIKISQQGYLELGFLLGTLLAAALLGLVAAAVAAAVVLPTLRAGIRND